MVASLGRLRGGGAARCLHFKDRSSKQNSKEVFAIANPNIVIGAFSTNRACVAINGRGTFCTIRIPIDANATTIGARIVRVVNVRIAAISSSNDNATNDATNIIIAMTANGRVVIVLY